MKAPNGVRVFTVPVNSAPGTIVLRVSTARAAACSLRSAARDDDPPAVIGQFRDAELERLADECIRILDLAQSDLGQRAERAKAADVHIEAAFVAPGNLCFHRQPVLVHLAKQLEARLPPGQLS